MTNDERQLSPEGGSGDADFQSPAHAADRRRTRPICQVGVFSLRDEAGNEVEAWNWEVFRRFSLDRTLFDEYRALTVQKHKDLAPPDEYVKVWGMRWPVVKQ